jgi:DNA-binding NarL/FixJ family response regulator
MTNVALIADDDEFFRAALKNILVDRLAFDEIIEAASFDEALEFISQRGDTSLALFDLSMPGMASAANLRAVRECFPHIRVGVVSGSNRREDIILALEAGVHGFVPKCLGIGLLVNAIQAVLDGIIYVPPCIADLPSPSTQSTPQAILAPDASSFFTPRQKDVLELITEGKSNKEIARALKLGEGTVKVHVAALFRVLGVSSRAAAAVAGSQLLAAQGAKVSGSGAVRH